MICEGKSIEEIVAVGTEWPNRIALMQPKNMVELGTGQGASAARIMRVLPPDSLFTTFNYVDGEQKFGEELEAFRSDIRLRRLYADTINPDTLKLVPDNVDLLFIDTTHEAWHAAAELRLWQYKLQDGALVIVDDLNQHDMAAFWDSIPYEKMQVPFQGTFRYDASRRYKATFDRPGRTAYTGNR